MDGCFDSTLRLPHIDTCTSTGFGTSTSTSTTDSGGGSMVILQAKNRVQMWRNQVIARVLFSHKTLGMRLPRRFSGSLQDAPLKVTVGTRCNRSDSGTRRKNIGMTRVKGGTRKEPIEAPGVSLRSPTSSTVTSVPCRLTTELLSDSCSSHPASHFPRCKATQTRFCHTQFTPRGSKKELNSQM